MSLKLIATAWRRCSKVLWHFFQHLQFIQTALHVTGENSRNSSIIDITWRKVTSLCCDFYRAAWNADAV